MEEREAAAAYICDSDHLTFSCLRVDGRAKQKAPCRCGNSMAPRKAFPDYFPFRSASVIIIQINKFRVDVYFNGSFSGTI